MWKQYPNEKLRSRIPFPFPRMQGLFRSEFQGQCFSWLISLLLAPWVILFFCHNDQGTKGRAGNDSIYNFLLGLSAWKAFWCQEKPMSPSPLIKFSEYKVNHKHTLSLCNMFSVSSEPKKDEYPKKWKVRNLYQASSIM